MRQVLLAVGMLFAAAGSATSAACARESRVELVQDDAAGTLTIRINGSEALVYQYADTLDTPHFWPVRSPSGKLLTSQHPPRDRFPHHRSLWIVDKIKLVGGKTVDFYHSWKNQAKPHDPNSPFQHRIRHKGFTKTEVVNNKAVVEMNLVWEMDRKTPVLDQSDRVVVYALEAGQYLVDMSFQLTASYGDVKFESDATHYAWPYVRMHPRFSGEQGGKIVDDQGRTGQEGTNFKYARWMDYSNTVDGVTEGLAMLSHPSNGRHQWLTREYGTWGPRRADKFSGTHFTLAKGESIGGRFGIFVHQGDSQTGKVAEQFQSYLKLTQDP